MAAPARNGQAVRRRFTWPPRIATPPFNEIRRQCHSPDSQTAARFLLGCGRTTQINPADACRVRRERRSRVSLMRSLRCRFEVFLHLLDELIDAEARRSLTRWILLEGGQEL